MLIVSWCFQAVYKWSECVFRLLQWFLIGFFFRTITSENVAERKKLPRSNTVTCQTFNRWEISCDLLHRSTDCMVAFLFWQLVRFQWKVKSTFIWLSNQELFRLLLTAFAVLLIFIPLLSCSRGTGPWSGYVTTLATLIRPYSVTMLLNGILFVLHGYRMSEFVESSWRHSLPKGQVSHHGSGITGSTALMCLTYLLSSHSFFAPAECQDAILVGIPGYSVKPDRPRSGHGKNLCMSDWCCLQKVSISRFYTLFCFSFISVVTHTLHRGRCRHVSLQREGLQGRVWGWAFRNDRKDRDFQIFAALSWWFDDSL